MASCTHTVAEARAGSSRDEGRRNSAEALSWPLSVNVGTCGARASEICSPFLAISIYLSFFSFSGLKPKRDLCTEPPKCSPHSSFPEKGNPFLLGSSLSALEQCWLEV